MSNDLLSAVSEIGCKAPAYKEARDFYNGDVGEVFASPLIKRLIGQQAKGYRVNLARRVVDAVLDRLKLASLTVPDDDAATAALQVILDDNKMGLIAKKLHRIVLSEGDVYVMAWPDLDSDVDNKVCIHLHSGDGMRVFYDDENPHVKRYAAQVWQEPRGDQQVIRVNLLYLDRIERWISDPGAKGDRMEEFHRYVGPDDEDAEEGGTGMAWPLPNPFGEIPVFHFRTDEPYGRPEHKDAFGPQLAITKLVAMQMTSADFQGFPQRWRLRSTTIQDNAHVGYPEEISPVGPRHLDRDRLESGPGTVWDLSDTSAVGAFAAADPATFLDPINFYARFMGASTATPLRFLEPSGDVPSGESLRADDAPLTEKIGDRQVWFADTWRELCMFALKLAGFDVSTVAVEWKPVKIIDDLTGWQTTQAKIGAGVPQEQALMEAGYRAEQVKEWANGAETTNLATRVEMLTKIGVAMQGLGAAVSLGVLNEAQVQQIVADLLDDTEREGDSAV